MNSLFINQKNKLKYQKKSKYIMLKSVLDFLTASILIIIISPIFCILGILVFINFGNPILFIQKRPGYKNKVFKMYKFRSMENKYDSFGNLAPDEFRINKFGNWLRKTSLDELPEIFNIIRGEMSFVGPRPLLVDYLKFYTPEEFKRHDIKPGITGLAQINGRNSISWEEKFKYDIFYSQNLSFFLDLKILIITFFKVLEKKGINNKGSLNMPRFQR